MDLKSSDGILSFFEQERDETIDKILKGSVDYPLVVDRYCRFQVTRTDFANQSFKCRFCQLLGNITHLYKYQPGTVFSIEAGKFTGKKMFVSKKPVVSKFQKLTPNLIHTDPETLAVLSNWILWDHFEELGPDFIPIQQIYMSAICHTDLLSLVEDMYDIEELPDQYQDMALYQLATFLNDAEETGLWLDNPKVGFVEEECTINDIKFPITIKINPRTSSINLGRIRLTSKPDFLSHSMCRIISLNSDKYKYKSCGRFFEDPEILYGYNLHQISNAVSRVNWTNPLWHQYQRVIWRGSHPTPNLDSVPIVYNIYLDPTHFL